MGEPLEGNPRYEFVRKLGQGSSGFVQLAKDRQTSELVAIKFIPRGWDGKQTKYVARELHIHQELSLTGHPHIVEFKHVFLAPK
jgi:serine/threonine-protein kinase SRK2